jgi:DNA-3-methyladenine glycosylase II
MAWFDSSLRVLRKDKHFAPLIKKHGKPDFSRYSANAPNLFAALLRSIIFQQLSGHAARAIHARVLALMPKGATPEQLLKIRPQKLRAAGLSIAKIEYLRDLARKFKNGTINEKECSKMSSDEIIVHLTQIKGVGEWTAHMILIFFLYRLDIFPTGDLGIRKGLQQIYGLKKLPDKKEMESIAKEWRAHASVASWYIWRVADNRKKS